MSTHQHVRELSIIGEKPFLKAKAVLHSQQGRTSKRTAFPDTQLCSLITGTDCQCLQRTPGNALSVSVAFFHPMHIYFIYMLVILCECIMYIIKHGPKN